MYTLNESNLSKQAAEGGSQLRALQPRHHSNIIRGHITGSRLLIYDEWAPRCCITCTADCGHTCTVPLGGAKVPVPRCARFGPKLPGLPGVSLVRLGAHRVRASSQALNDFAQQLLLACVEGHRLWAPPPTQSGETERNWPNECQTCVTIIVCEYCMCVTLTCQCC
jgi:hypothetical protein